MDLAASISVDERRKEYKKQNPNQSGYISSFTKANELNRTKIYDYETKKLLGEYRIDNSDNKKNGALGEVLNVLDAYKFYNVK